MQHFCKIVYNFSFQWGQQAYATCNVHPCILSVTSMRWYKKICLKAQESLLLIGKLIKLVEYCS